MRRQLHCQAKQNPDRSGLYEGLGWALGGQQGKLLLLPAHDQWCPQCPLHLAWHFDELAPLSPNRALVCPSAGNEAAARAEQERLQQQQLEDALDEQEPQAEDAEHAEGRDLDDMWEGQDYVGMEVGKEEVDRLLEKYSDAEWIEVDEEENRRIPFHRSAAMALAYPCPLVCLLVTSWLHAICYCYKSQAVPARWFETGFVKVPEGWMCLLLVARANNMQAHMNGD